MHRHASTSESYHPCRDTGTPHSTYHQLVHSESSHAVPMGYAHAASRTPLPISRRQQAFLTRASNPPTHTTRRHTGIKLHHQIRYIRVRMLTLQRIILFSHKSIKPRAPGILCRQRIKNVRESLRASLLPILLWNALVFRVSKIKQPILGNRTPQHSPAICGRNRTQWQITQISTRNIASFRRRRDNHAHYLIFASEPGRPTTDVQFLAQ